MRMSADGSCVKCWWSWNSGIGRRRGESGGDETSAGSEVVVDDARKVFAAAEWAGQTSLVRAVRTGCTELTALEAWRC